MERLSRCELCGRPSPRLTKHHLIPRTRHRNKRNKKNFDRREVRERVAMLCRPCHKTIHAVLGQKELEYEYNSVDLLRGHPEIARFVEWVRKRPPGRTVRVRRTGSQQKSKEVRQRQRRRQRRSRTAETER